MPVSSGFMKRQQVPLEQAPQERSEAAKPLIAFIHFYLRAAEPSRIWELLHFLCSDLPVSALCSSLQSEHSSMAPLKPCRQQ